MWVIDLVDFKGRRLYEFKDSYASSEEELIKKVKKVRQCRIIQILKNDVHTDYDTTIRAKLELEL